MKRPLFIICCILLLNLKANAQIADPSVTNIQCAQTLGCFDSTNTAQVIIENFGAAIDFSLNPLVFDLRVRHANGTTNYIDTISVGQLPNSASQVQIIPNINLYEGGCYFLNTTLTLIGGGNSNLANDSLTTAYKVCNTRPKGTDYSMFVGDTIPSGQGLSISNCPDSIMIPFNNFCFTGNIPGSPTQCSSPGAGCFASATLPNLPLGANITSGEIIVTNLAPNFFPSNIQSTRFSLYQGSLPTTFSNVFHNGLVGIGTPAFGTVTYHSFPSAADMNAMYVGNVPVTPIVKLGHWSTSYCTSTNFMINSGNPTTAFLKIKFTNPTPTPASNVTTGVTWFEQAVGGVSISDSSVLDPLNTPNTIVNNSSTPGIYTFYGACRSDTNCRVAVNLNITFPQSLNTYKSIFDDFIIYPNPARTELIIKSDHPIRYDMRIVNLVGVTLLRKDLQDKAVKIDLKDIASGIYILQLSTAKEKKEFKILIER